MGKSSVRFLALLAGASFFVGTATMACNVEVTSGEDGEGGEGGEGGYGTTKSANATTAVGQATTQTGCNTTAVVATTVGTTTGTTDATTVTTAVSTGTGGCPPEPQWNECGVASASAGTGMATTCDLTYCNQGPNADESFERHCTTETNTCTCTQGSDSCTCNWNGDCSTPCCGPDDFGP